MEVSEPSISAPDFLHHTAACQLSDYKRTICIIWVVGRGGVVDYYADASVNMCLNDWFGWPPRSFHSRCSETEIVDFWLNKR